MKLQLQRVPEVISVVVTRGVCETLSADEINTALNAVREKMEISDPENPNLWTVAIGQHTVWGILDEGAGLNGEPLLTLLFPSEY